MISTTVMIPCQIDSDRNLKVLQYESYPLSGIIEHDIQGFSNQFYVRQPQAITQSLLYEGMNK